jgi:hypothetical protein
VDVSKPLLFILFLILISCNQKRNEREVLDDFLKSIKVSNNLDFKALVIIPLDGCSGCIDATLEFAQLNISDKNLFFVIATSSPKLVKLRLGYIDKPNVYTDSQLESRDKGLVSFSPTLFIIEKDSFARIDLTAENIGVELPSLKRKLDRWKKNGE